MGAGGGCSNKSRCAASPWRAAPPNVTALVPGGKKGSDRLFLKSTPVEDSLKNPASNDLSRVLQTAGLFRRIGRR